jgi:hypothetical protein
MLNLKRLLLSLSVLFTAVSAYAQDSFWPTAGLNPGPTLSTSSNTVSLFMSEEGKVPVVAYINSGSIEVWRFGSSGWNIMGTALSGTHSKLKLIGGDNPDELFVVSENGGGGIQVFQYDGFEWTSYYTITGAYTIGRMSFDAHYDDATGAIKLVYQDDASKDILVENITAKNVGTNIGTTPFNNGLYLTAFSLAYISPTNVFFSGTNVSGTIFVGQFDGSSWLNQSPVPSLSTAGLAKTKVLKTSDNRALLVYLDAIGNLFKATRFNGTGWDNWTVAMTEEIFEWDAAITSTNELFFLFKDDLNLAYLRKLNSSTLIDSEEVTDFANNFDVEVNTKSLPYITRQDLAQQSIVVESYCFAPITINTQVADIAGPLCEETPVSFSISATANGPFPLTYQWLEYGFPLEDETNASLSLATDFDSYTVNVFDGCRVYYSPSVSVLSVDPLPQFSEYELFNSACEGNIYNISGNPSGFDNIEWYKNGALISGETNSSLTLSSITQTDEGLYVQRAINTCGFRETFTIRLDVDEPVTNFTINQPTVSVCGDRYTIDNLQPVNLRSYRWASSSPEGRFLPDNQVLNPIYVASAEDLLNGSATIFINAPFSYACGSIPEETFTIQFNNGGLPTLDAGSDLVILGSTVSLNASITNAGSINWITGGTGTFDDPAIENPTYTLSSEDLADGAVELLIRVNGGTTCSETTLIDTVLLYADAGLNISGITAEPLSKVVLFKRMNGFMTRFLETSSDGNGDYAFGGLSDGEYYLATFHNKSVYYYGNSYDWSTSTPIVLNGSSATGIDLPLIPILRDEHTESINETYFFGSDIISGIINLRLPTNLRTADGGAEKPLQDATVYLLDADGTTRLDVTTTNGDGVYSFTGLSGTTFTIEVEYPGTVYAVTPPSSVSTDGDDYTTTLANAAMVKSRASSIFTRPQDTPAAPLFTAWPNPAKEQVYIRSESFGASSIKASIYSSDGRIIKTETITTTQQTIMLDISGLKASLYYIRLADTGSDQVWSLPIWVE